MCQLLKLRSSIMSGKVAAISFVLIFCFAECAAGSCLSYGHSCWGAHGKRSGAPNVENPLKDKSDPLIDTRWVLSRLVQAPLELRPWKSPNDALTLKHQPIDVQGFSGNEGQDEQDSNIDLQDVLSGNEDVLYMDDPATRARINEDKIRLFKLMKKNAARLN